MTRTIEIIVTPSGQTSVQTNGFSGPSCRDASKFLEEALGQQVGEHHTSEFYQAAETETQNRQQA